MQNLLNSCRLATLSLLLCLSFIGFVHSTDAQVQQCEKKRPHSSMPTCNGESERRYFLHATKGCKKFGICYEDALFYDNQTDNNYFLSWGDCQRTCMESIQCPTIEAPMNGVIMMDEYSGWGGSIYYSCHTGYSLVGTNKRTCQRNQTWTGDGAPYCQAQCKRPPEVANVKSIAPVQDHYNVGTVIYYTCADGFIGNSQRMCTDDGAWSGRDPECVEMEEAPCHEPSPIDHGTVTALDRSVGAYLIYSCEPGFILAGNATRRCGADTLWEGEEPICWKLGLQEKFESNTNDVTNQTVSFPIGTRNIRIEIVSTNDIHLDTFDSDDIDWSFVNSHGNSEWPEGVLVYSNYLEFQNILTSREQEGRYTVKVGNFSVYFMFRIAEEGPTRSSVPPSFKISRVVGDGTVGSDTTITCVFEGCPVPSVTWYHKGVPVEFNERVESVHISTHTFTICDLTIRTFSLDDTGEYECVGGNGYGNDSSQIVLELREPESESNLEKRSVRRDERSPLCSSPSSVTIVGRVQRNMRMRRSPHMMSYQIRVDRILNGATESLSRDQNLKTIILDTSVEYPARLKRNSDYILKGNVVKDIFYVSGYESVQSHSNELEGSLLQC